MTILVGKVDMLILCILLKVKDVNMIKEIGYKGKKIFYLKIIIMKMFENKIFKIKINFYKIIYKIYFTNLDK